MTESLSPPQQSQLSHYPERKITEFQLRIEALEREHKRFTAKLRALDASCKEEPWTPRAYRRRRAEERDLHLPSIGQCLRGRDSPLAYCKQRGGEGKAVEK